MAYIEIGSRYFALICLNVMFVARCPCVVTRHLSLLDHLLPDRPERHPAQEMLAQQEGKDCHRYEEQEGPSCNDRPIGDARAELRGNIRGCGLRLAVGHHQRESVLVPRRDEAKHGSSRNSRRRLRQYVLLGETIPAPESALGACVQLRTDMIPKFDLGMDENTLRTRKLVAGVRQDSEAFKGGLRDGQQIIATSIYWNDPLKPVKLIVRTAEGNHTFEYYPRGSMSALPQYHLDTDAYAANPGKCAILSKTH